MERSFEREIIPMAREFGMALAPWDVLGAGRFRTDEEEERRRETGEKGRSFIHQYWERNDVEVTVSKALEVVAGEVGVGSITAGMLHYFSAPLEFLSNFCFPQSLSHMLCKRRPTSFQLLEEGRWST